MERPQFTIRDLLHATALAGAAIVAWRLLQAWFPAESNGLPPDMAEPFARARAFGHATFIIMLMAIGITLRYKRQYLWWPGAWIGLAVGVVGKPVLVALTKYLAR